MAQKLKPGDRVEWETSQGTARGKIVKEQRSETRVKGHKVAASPDDPQFIVESETSGKQAAHKPGALGRAS